ncbi:MAG: MotA/TolQ/ExbB proton channel family protein [Betaproteobacteria bacterium]|nr:MotA/TolQ/ExbB proton channel family protein [Betaproteobacteria bacterium]
MFAIIQAAGWPIWPLLACSIVALALIIERSMTLRESKVMPPKLLQDAIAVSQHQLPAADTVHKLEQSSPLGRVLASGFRLLAVQPGADRQTIDDTMEDTGRHVAHSLERYLPGLATIASAAPLLGLLGTVVGMIEIFGSQAPTGGNPALLAHGISVALYNTAFGLIIAVPTLMLHRYFRSKVDSFVLQLESSSKRFADHLQRLSRKQSAAS